MQPAQFPLSFMDSPKSTKWAPLRSIVSGRGAVACNVTKELGNIIWPMVGQPTHLIKNTQPFVDHIKSVHLLPREAMVSYDIRVLFTSVLADPAISRTSMSIPQIITLLDFWLKNTYFLFQGKYFEQIHDAAMFLPLVYLLPICLWKSLKSRP